MTDFNDIIEEAILAGNGHHATTTTADTGFEW